MSDVVLFDVDLHQNLLSLQSENKVVVVMANTLRKTSVNGRKDEFQCFYTEADKLFPPHRE